MTLFEATNEKNTNFSAVIAEAALLLLKLMPPQAFPAPDPVVPTPLARVKPTMEIPSADEEGAIPCGP